MNSFRYLRVFPPNVVARGLAMEAQKTQKALLAISFRWRSIILGLSLGLFISALFTSNFAEKIVPNPLVQAWVPLTSSNASISSKLYIFFFRGSRIDRDASDSDEAFLSTVDGNLPGADAKASFPRGTFSTPEEEDRTTSASNEETEKSFAPVRGNVRSPRNESFHRNETGFRDIGSLSAAQKGDRRNHASARAQGLSLPLVNDSPCHNASVGNGSSACVIRNRSASDASRELKIFAEEASKKGGSVFVQRAEELEGNPGSSGGFPSASSNSSKGSYGNCDFSLGRWVEDDSHPLYQPGSCPYVDDSFSCQKNGRPDSGYMRRRWIPRDCDIPRFNAIHMLERLRGKRLVFVGDSLNRNQWESMLCILRESLPDKTRIVEIHGGRITKLPGSYVFKFLDYDCRVEFYTSHFLVDEQERDDGDVAAGKPKFTVRLDKIDKSERRWRKANVLVFNTGHWWTPDKIGEGENYFQEGAMVHPKLEVMVAYQKAIWTWAEWVDKHVNPATTRVFFRGYSPAHYEGGQWNSGGQCHRETEPIYNESYIKRYPDKMQVVEGVVQKMRRARVEILNITRLSDFRKEAHPSVYGYRREDMKEYQDCSHWCLPGLPDVWNELLYAALFHL